MGLHDEYAGETDRHTTREGEVVVCGSPAMQG